MKYILLVSLLTSAVFAAPVAQQSKPPNGQNGNGRAQGGGQRTGQQNGQQTQNAPTGGTAQKGTPSAADLATAVSNWQADTSMVSNFLNTGSRIQNNVAFKQAATVALNAEIDELNHKAIIDSAIGNMPNVIAANSTLATGGSFQDVVDKLRIMSQQGRAAVANIDLINQNRCVNVLPNIDVYMAATGSKSQAVRPAACDQTGVIGGVQGNGATPPGGTPGTPQAAFTAAKALAQGTGNGIVQNGNAQNGNAQNGNAQPAGNQPAGNQQAGNQQAGNQQAGNRQTGNRQGANTGAANAGAANTGTSKTGAAKAGAGNAGAPKTGATNAQNAGTARPAAKASGGGPKPNN